MKIQGTREQLDAQDADLASSRFDDVNLADAIFQNVNLRGARFSDVNLTGASIDDANLSQMTLFGVPVSEMLAAWRSRAGALLFVKDLDALARFYAAVLGARADRAGADVVDLAAPGMRLRLHRLPPTIARGLELTTPPALRSQTPVKLVFEVASLAAARELARAHGGQVLAEEHEWADGGARVCDGADPEGNVVQFVQPP
ncbi:MAG TPA: VOC family protein [Polyangia bacterium]|nr:VOC family protein [Polyangia bacterium]